MSGRQSGALEFLAVALGGALGTGLRYALLETFPSHACRFPTTTLAVNLTGSLVLGLALAWRSRTRSEVSSYRWLPRPQVWR